MEKIGLKTIRRGSAAFCFIEDVYCFDWNGVGKRDAVKAGSQFNLPAEGLIVYLSRELPLSLFI